MKTREEIIRDAFCSSKTRTMLEVIQEVYEQAFANGFKQGNDNAKEVMEFEKKKTLLQINNKIREYND